jgi:predicted metal-dependent hydrolase
MEAAFKRGLEKIRAGRYFEAHEELEEAWRAASAEERDFFQGLVHVAVAWYQAGRGRPVATARQLEKAARRLAPFAPEHRGVDVERVLAQVDAAQASVAAGSLELDPPQPTL